MRTVLEDIKNNNYKQVYLLYGEEAYLRNQYRQKLLSALVPEGDTMNLHIYEDSDVPVKEVIDLAETMPFSSYCIRKASYQFLSNTNTYISYITPWSNVLFPFLSLLQHPPW